MQWFRRKHYVVDKKLQYTLAIYNTIYSFILLLSLGVVLLMPLYFELSATGLSHLQQGEAAGKVLYLHSRSWPVILAIVIVLGLHSITVSHKIAGPLQRFRRTFQRITKGDISLMERIRRDDYLQQDWVMIEEVIDFLRIRITAMKAEQQAVEKALNELIETSQMKPVESTEPRLSMLREATFRLKEELGYFKT